MDQQQLDYRPLSDALVYIAGQCDYAHAVDGTGFNQADTVLGHRLAKMPDDVWTDDVAFTAYTLVYKYGRQLRNAGIDRDELPKPPGAEEWLEQSKVSRSKEREAILAELDAERDRPDSPLREIEEMLAERRERGKDAVAAWDRKQKRAAKSFVICDGEGAEVELGFPYDPDMVSEARNITGRTWDPARKRNTYPFHALAEVVAFADRYDIPVGEEIRGLVAFAQQAAEVEATKPQVYLDGGTIVIDAEWTSATPAMNDALRKYNGGRSTWDRIARVHCITKVHDAAKLTEIFTEFDLRVDDTVTAFLAAAEQENAKQGEREADVKASATAITAEPLGEVPGLAADAAVMPQQWPAIRYAVKHRRVLLGDEMGWGKTLQSLAAVAITGSYPAVVVCRPSLTRNWVNEITRFFPDLKVFEAQGTVPTLIVGGVDVVVIGTAALGTPLRDAKKRAVTDRDGNIVFPWVDKLAGLAPKALVLDEGQDAKEQTAKRTQALMALAGDVHARNGVVLNLTGTAIVNRPRELATQLEILGRMEEFHSTGYFLVRYCESESNKYGRVFKGAEHLDELHHILLSKGIMVRRTDNDALGLPANTRHILSVPATDLAPEAMKEYRTAEQDTVNYLTDQAREIAKRLGEDPASAAVQAKMRALAAEHLVRINTLRQLVARAKLPAAKAFIDGFTAAGEKVMIAAHHRDIVDALAKRYGGLKLQGGQTADVKEQHKAAYQTKPVAEAPAITVAIEAGGVGHTLTAGRIGVQVEMPWTPGAMSQMEKRQHRIGQTRECEYHVVLAEGTVDADMYAVVSGKQTILDQVLDGKAPEGADDDQQSIVAAVAWRLAQAGLDQDR